jgi:Tfp pilus assembly PilM family ATPase
VTLTVELHAAVREKRVLDLLPRIEQLLELKPDHAFARKLAGQVQKYIARLIESRLAERQYDEALKLSERIAPELRTPSMQDLHRRTAELASLSWDLRHAPAIDRTLVGIAERLEKLVPGDAAIVALCKKLRQRYRITHAAPPREPLPWARPSHATALGVPVAWLTRFARIAEAQGLETEELLAHRGRFAVASGLALAGLRRAAVTIDLLAPHRHSMLGRIGRLVHSRAVRSAWGLDLSASGLKAVKLAWDESLRHPVLESALLIEHAKPLGQAVNEAEVRKLMTETLTTFLDRRPSKAERTCAGLPGRMLLSKQFELPPVAADKLPSVLEFEARREFPFPLEQLVWDYELFDEATDAAEPAARPWRRSLVVATRKATAKHFLDVFRQLDIRVDMLQADFVAVHNLVFHEYFAPSAELPAGQKAESSDAGPSAASAPVSAVAAIDVGCDATNLVVSSPHALWYRSCGIAGQSFTRALVKDFNLTIAQAEQLKRAPESTENLGKVYEALSPGFAEFLTEAQETLAAYAQAEPDRPIQQVLGMGGGFSLHGLFRCLRCGR